MAAVKYANSINEVRDVIDTHRFLQDRIEAAEHLGYKTVWIKAAQGPEGSVMETERNFYIRLTGTTVPAFSYMAKIPKK